MYINGEAAVASLILLSLTASICIACESSDEKRVMHVVVLAKVSIWTMHAIAHAVAAKLNSIRIKLSPIATATIFRRQITSITDQAYQASVYLSMHSCIHQ